VTGQTTMRDILTLEEIAGYLRVNEKTVYRLVNEGSIPATKIGHQWRFKKTAIDEWLDQRSVTRRAEILIIDDDEEICSLFRDCLEEVGYTVTATVDPSEGLEIVKRRDFDLAFLDLKMPGIDGAELLRLMRAVKPELPVTIITGYSDSDLMMRAMACGPLGVLKKPVDCTDILAATSYCLDPGRPPRQSSEGVMARGGKVRQRQ